MSESILREYQPGDWLAMHALDVLCFEPPFQFSRRAMRGGAEAPDAISILAETDGALTGFFITQLVEGIGYIVTLDVAPVYRRHGLGRRLMQAMEEAVRGAGASGVALHVFEGNSSAIQFYEQVGYEFVGIVQRFYGRGLDALLYRKRL